MSDQLPASRFGDVIDYVLTNLPPFLGENANGNTIQVAEGWPGDELESEAVLLDGTTIEQEWANLGSPQRPRRGEDVTLKVYVQVDRDSDTATEARHRAVEILNLFSEWARIPEHIILGGICAHAALRVTSSQPFTKARGHRYVIEAELLARQIRF